MKKLILITACLLSFLEQARAQELVKAEITPIIITANGEATAQMSLINPSQDVYSFQFDLYVPEGVTLKLNNKGKIKDNVSYELSDRIEDHQVDVSDHLDEGFYRFSAISRDKVYPGENDNVVLTFHFVASDRISTGQLEAKIDNQRYALDSSGDAGTGYKPAAANFNVAGKIDVAVSAAGYATFSWPRTLNFSQTGLKVYRAAVLAELDNDYGKMTTALIENGIVAANEGVLLKGNAGTYNPATTEATPTSADNFFIGTAGGEVIPTAEQHYYVFAQKQNGSKGFYKVKTGVKIPQYKAYLNLDGDYSRITFDLAEEATGIRDLQNGSTDELYDLRGVKQNSQKQRKGVYIQNGKKVVIK